MAPSRRRVLIMIDHAVAHGGAERFAVDLATRLPQDRFEPWFCATRSMDSASTAALDEAGVRHITLGRRTKWDVHRFRRLVAVLRNKRFDILHTHMFGSNVWGALIGTACRVPVIVAHEHSWSYEDDRLRMWVDGQIVGRLVDRFVAVSNLDAERMASLERINPTKIVVIPNGYIPGPATNGDTRAELGLLPDALVVAVAAVFRPEKRLDLLLQAFAQVGAALPKSHLVLAGDGPCRGTLARQATLLGLNGRAHFLGMRSDIDSVLRAADVGALASDREGSPLFMFECLANETPLVATRVGGVPDVVIDGETGVLVPRGDVDALAQGLIALLSDPVRRARMAAAATESARRYTIDATVARIASLYDTLVA
jgi:glycosyltransferase involved in cell wall biosynthesis